MNKRKIYFSKNKKRILSLASPLSFALLPTIIVSCGNAEQQNNDLKPTQDWIDEKYNEFKNSKQIIANVYIEYFLPYDSSNNQNEFNINFETLSNFFNIKKIDGVEQKFKAKYDSTKNVLIVTYQIFNNNELLNPSNINQSTKSFEVKVMNQPMKDDISTIINEWNKFKVTIENSNVVVDNSKIQTIDLSDKAKIAKINPTFLNGPFNDERNDFFTKSLNAFINQANINQILVNNGWGINFDIKLNLDGTIKIDIKILNKKNANNIYFVLNDRSTRLFDGFKTNSKSQEEIIEIYKHLGKSYDLNILNKNKNYPFLIASSIYDIDQLKQFMINLNTNINDESKFKLPEFFNPTINHNELWYELNIQSINANDINGVVNATFEIRDKFTNLILSPQNISKTLTFTGFKSLVTKDPKNDSTKDDYSLLENVYKAYEIFKELELKDKYINIASHDQPVIDIEWLKQNTNIGEKITIEPDNSFFIESEWIYQKPEGETITKRKTKFRIKQDSIKNNQAINDDVNGIKSIPFILEFEANFENTSPQWHVALAQEKTNDVANNQFGSKTESVAYIKIGKYKTNDLNIASLIYSEIKSIVNNSITIEFNDMNLFESIYQLDQSSGINKIKTLVDQKIMDIIKKSNNQIIKDNINNLNNKFSFKCELNPISFEVVNFDLNNKPIEISTSLFDFKLTSKDNEDAIFDFYDNLGKQQFPKLKIIIKYVK